MRMMMGMTMKKRHNPESPRGSQAVNNDRHADGCESHADGMYRGRDEKMIQSATELGTPGGPTAT